MKNKIKQIREKYVSISGFSGGWNVILEGYTSFEDDNTPFFRSGVEKAISQPMSVKSAEQEEKDLCGFGRRVKITETSEVVVVDDLASLARHINCDAIRGKLLVELTGNIFSEDEYEAATKAGYATCSKKGFARRSTVNVPMGQPYWLGPKVEPVRQPAPLPLP